jgi:hypothetical protein
MNELPIEGFQHAIRQTHGAKAQLLSIERVHESFEGHPAWRGEVLVFRLVGHPTASKCYAWEVDGEVTAILGVGHVDSPEAAVRAAILAQEDEDPQAV